MNNEQAQRIFALNRFKEVARSLQQTGVHPFESEMWHERLNIRRTIQKK
jgi:predicted component of type VI protein secretion system